MLYSVGLSFMKELLKTLELITVSSVVSTMAMLELLLLKPIS